MRFLVTGGAGYIGSHVVRMAQQSGHEVHIVDDFSTGVSARVDAPVTTLDLAAPEAVKEMTSLLKGGFDAVIHFAARKQVGESVAEPEAYYQSNVGGMANLLQAMRASEVKKLVFSSSAAVYGMSDQDLVSETSTTTPINPYGETKLIGEWMVKNAKVWGLQGVSLRYFNVAGTGWGDLADTAALNLIPIAIKALQSGESPRVFGTDYATPDGSGIRDYIHVSDLARAHLSALAYLGLGEPKHSVFNVGTGSGSSVLEVLTALNTVSGLNRTPEILPSRAGDPARLVADVGLIQAELSFTCEFGLKEIIESAWKSAN